MSYPRFKFCLWFAMMMNFEFLKFILLFYNLHTGGVPNRIGHSRTILIRYKFSNVALVTWDTSKLQCHFTNRWPTLRDFMVRGSGLPPLFIVHHRHVPHSVGAM